VRYDGSAVESSCRVNACRGTAAAVTA